MHSIRFKIAAVTVGAILTAMMCVFLVVFSTIQADDDRRSVETMGLIAQDTKKTLENDSESIEQSVGMIANIASDSLDSAMLVRGGVIGPAAKDVERAPEQEALLDTYLAEYCADLQATCATVASHTQGIITYYYCINPEVSENVHGFFYSRVGKTGFNERETLDARELDPNDIEHTTWYYTPIQRGRPSWVGPYTAHFLDEMIICSYLVPIYKAGMLIGVLGMDVPITDLIAQVDDIRVYETGFACLLDAQGRVVYHPTLETGSVPNSPVYTNVLQRDSSEGDLIRYTVDGEERQLSFTTLSNGMKLVIVAPTAEVNATSIQLLRIILGITLIIVIVFAVLTMLIMGVITKPLQRLTAASQRLAAGDYDVELDYKGEDEVGALTNAFKAMRDQLEKDIDDLNRRVRTDDLTGLSNQGYFFDLAQAEERRLRESGKRPAMLYFNLVGMKHFNQQYGRDEGDRLICAVADILAGYFGKQNTSRFGQDHFAALTDEERMEEALRSVFRDCLDANGGKTLPINVGVYQYSMEEVSASIACDRAKHACDQRRGSYVSGFCYFDSKMLKQVDIVRHVIDHLDQALNEKWVQVYYQPIVYSATGRVCDEEALSRWFDPERGMLSPEDFIPALENASLIYKLDLYVLDRVLEKMKLLQESGLEIVPHSINLSRSDFEMCDIVEEFCQRVDAAGVDRSMVTVEITESIIGSDFDFMKKQIERFRELGFAVWMDDFGSGYSSLDVLRDVSFDVIKLDMSFMRELDKGKGGKIILTKLMSMANALGLETVCEGVETEDQCRFLQEIGCTKLQGYYFSRPKPLSEILDMRERGIGVNRGIGIPDRYLFALPQPRQDGEPAGPDL